MSLNVLLLTGRHCEEGTHQDSWFLIAAACRPIAICSLHHPQHAVANSLWSELLELSHTACYFGICTFKYNIRVFCVSLLLAVLCWRIMDLNIIYDKNNALLLLIKKIMSCFIYPYIFHSNYVFSSIKGS